MNLNLWRSLYPYNGEFPGSLTFTANEYFLVLRKENEYWFLVSENKGTLGCVPINYLVEADVSKEKLLRFVEKAIGSLSQKSASVISKRDDILRELLDMKKEKFNGSEINEGIEMTNSNNQSINITKKKHFTVQNSVTPCEIIDQESGKYSTFLVDHLSIDTVATNPKAPSVIPDGLAFTLTDSIRQTTKASHVCSIKTLQILLDVLKFEVPDLKMWTDAIEDQLLNESKFNLADLFYDSPDWKILSELFVFFQQCKNDSQERSWSLHESVSDLRGKLTMLLETLRMSNRHLVVNFLQSHSYEPLLSLIEWYQMEQRAVLRRLLLRIFLVCSEINKESVGIYLQSILPLELVRDLIDTNLDSRNFTFAALLLTILVNGSEDMHIDLQDKLNVDFCVSMLLKLSDFHNESLNSCKSDGNDADDEYFKDFDEMKKINGEDIYYMDDVVIEFLLTFNKRQMDAKVNPVLASLQAKPEYTRLFIEKLIVAFNRNEDPAYFDPSKKCEVNSVRKILCDIFSCKSLSEIIYKNDADVIIDIISRELSDLPPDSPELSEYLVLLDLIMTNSDYLERGKYKSAGLIRALSVLRSVAADEINEFDKMLSVSMLQLLEA